MRFVGLSARWEEPGGGSRTASLKRHAPYARREGVEHNVVNANAYPYSFIEVEHLKDGGDAERKAMLNRFVGAINAHDLDGIMASMADDFVFWSSASAHSQGGVFEGREAVAEAFAAIFRSFPDAAWTEKPDHPLCFPRLVGMDVRWSGHGWEDVAPARCRRLGSGRRPDPAEKFSPEDNGEP